MIVGKYYFKYEVRTPPRIPRRLLCSSLDEALLLFWFRPFVLSLYSRCLLNQTSVCRSLSDDRTTGSTTFIRWAARSARCGTWRQRLPAFSRECSCCCSWAFSHFALCFLSPFFNVCFALYLVLFHSSRVCLQLVVCFARLEAFCQKEHGDYYPFW